MNKLSLELQAVLMRCADACDLAMHDCATGDGLPERAKAMFLARDCALACRFALQLLRENSPVAAFQLGAIFMISQVCGDTCSDIQGRPACQRCTEVCFECMQKCMEAVKLDKHFVESQYNFRNLG
jgi:hypothetical protein